MRANKIDANQPAIVQALRDAGCKVQCLNQQKEGVPDLLVYREVRENWDREEELFLLEVKNPAGRGTGLTPDQVKFHNEWPVTVVTNPEEALRAVGL